MTRSSNRRTVTTTPSTDGEGPSAPGDDPGAEGPSCVFKPRQSRRTLGSKWLGCPPAGGRTPAYLCRMRRDGHYPLSHLAVAGRASGPRRATAVVAVPMETFGRTGRPVATGPLPDPYRIGQHVASRPYGGFAGSLALARRVQPTPGIRQRPGAKLGIVEQDPKFRQPTYFGRQRRTSRGGMKYSRPLSWARYANARCSRSGLSAKKPKPTLHG